MRAHEEYNWQQEAMLIGSFLTSLPRFPSVSITRGTKTPTALTLVLPALVVRYAAQNSQTRTAQQMKYQFTLRKLFLWMTVLCVICAIPMLGAVLFMLGTVALAAVFLALVGAAVISFTFLIASLGAGLAHRFNDHKK